MKIDEALIKKIVERAKTSRFGLDEEQMPDLTAYGTRTDQTFEVLAQALINTYHSKYDIISIMQAVMEVMQDYYLTEAEELEKAIAEEAAGEDA